MTTKKPTEHPTKIECVDCRKLPSFDETVIGISPSTEFRPKAPRKIDPRSGPRSPRCTTHFRAKTTAAKTAGREKRREKTYGVDRDTQLQLWELQGKACPCGRKRADEPPPGVHMDHDRKLADTHDHPREQGCPECVTGFLCQSCNREIIGRLEALHGDRWEVGRALARLANHVLTPPMAQLRSRTEVAS